MKHKSAIAFVVSLMLALFVTPQALEAQRLDELFDFDSFEETLFCAYSIHEEEMVPSWSTTFAMMLI